MSSERTFNKSMYLRCPFRANSSSNPGFEDSISEPKFPFPSDKTSGSPLVRGHIIGLPDEKAAQASRETLKKIMGERASAALVINVRTSLIITCSCCFAGA